MLSLYFAAENYFLQRLRLRKHNLTKKNKDFVFLALFFAKKVIKLINVDITSVLE